LIKSPPAEVTPSSAVRIPPFHYGSVVPFDFFIDRETEMEEARGLIMTRQSFLIVGRRRAGKTSFGQKLIHSLMSENAARTTRVLGTYLDLQQYSDLDVDRFLGHTLLNLIGEVARQVFCCKYTTLSRKNPFDIHPALSQDVAFSDLLELSSEVVARTHTRRSRSAPSGLAPHDFESFIADLLEICRHKGWTDVFIFYDEANRLPLDLSVGFLTWNVEALNRAGIVSIYSASPEMAKKFNPWSDREIRIGPFSNSVHMSKLLLRYYFGSISSKADLPVAGEAMIRIWELSHGIPYLIQHISGQSFSMANLEGARRVEERHVHLAHEELSRRRPEIFRD
jgi:AAA+ ATPase superfamily predicted ATPase